MVEARLEKIRAQTDAARALAEKRTETAKKPGLLNKIMQSVARDAAGRATRSLMRGLPGSIFGGRR